MGEKVRKGLIKADILTDYRPPEGEPDLSGRVGFGEAYPSKALYKFLGYQNVDLHIGFNPSLSFVIDTSVCRAYCRLNERDHDRIWFNGERNPVYEERGRIALNAFRKIWNVNRHFDFAVFLQRNYEKAKGLSESSAVAAASAWALARCLFDEKDLSREFVSTLARLVSGSGTRSVFGGASMWITYPFMNSQDSYAFPVNIDLKDLKMNVYPDSLSITTSNAHGNATNSIFFEPWVQNKYNWIMNDLEDGFSRNRLLNRGMIDSLYLHSLIYSSGLISFSSRSLDLVSKYSEFRKKNEAIWFVQDTGPSLLIIAEDEKILNDFSNFSGRNGIRTTIPEKTSSTQDNELLKRSMELFDSK